MSYLELKPFSGETDAERKYDLIRALVIFMAVRDHPNKSKAAITSKFLKEIKLSKKRTNEKHLRLYKSRLTV